MQPQMHNQGTDVPLAKGQGCRRRGADPPAVVSPSIPVTGHPVFCRGFYFDGNLVALSEGGEIQLWGGACLLCSHLLAGIWLLWRDPQGTW